MKILNSAQLKECDAYTIECEAIQSVDLMERAARAFTEAVMSRWDSNVDVKVFAGPGNNGGDALAVARMLATEGYQVSVFLFKANAELSPDCAVNRQRLLAVPGVKFEEITTTFNPPLLTGGDLVIDGLFGTGVSRPLNGGFASVVKYINSSAATVVSIDIPSGLMCEDNSYNVLNHIIRADYTFTFQFPKLVFFFSDCSQYFGEWEILDIGVRLADSVKDDATPYYFVEHEQVASMLHKRSKFAHKGTMGHAMLVAGKRGMAGAAILSAKACMRTGVGKLSVRTPEYNVPVIQITVPEAVLSIDTDPSGYGHSFDSTEYDALAIGPGIGTESQTVQAFIEQISMAKCPLVLDADALNILGSHRGWLQQLPSGTILTPHKKELFGLISSTRNCYEQLERARELAQRQHIYIVIKGAYSAICMPTGKVLFNSTGNPGMATAGSGDVLTGIILSLLAQDYTQDDAVILGVYLHGLAGDLAAEHLSCESIIASDIIDYLPHAFKHLRAK